MYPNGMEWFLNFGILLLLTNGSLCCKSSSSPTRKEVSQVVAKEDDFSCNFEAKEEYRNLAEANTKFFIKLYKRIKGQKNVLVSPFSIFTGLSLLQLATDGDTKAQYESILEYGIDNSDLIRKEARNIHESLEKLSAVSKDSFSLSAANNIFIDSGFSVKESYHAKAACFFHSNVSRLPLQTNPQESADKMNAWVSEKTNNKIQDLISPGALGGNTEAVLLNSVYFKAPWKLPFSKYATRENELFTKLDGTQVNVDLMALEKNIPYAKLDAGGLVIQLDYNTCKECDEQSSEMAMYVFVKDEGVEWNAFEEDILKEEILHGRGLEFEVESMRLEMPRFEISHQESLVPTLAELGMNLGGDFSAMTESPIQVSDVLHKAYLKVDENGSEGAAATAVFMSRMLFIPEVKVTVDKTFFLSLVHKQSNVIVFAGMVDSPLKLKPT